MTWSYDGGLKSTKNKIKSRYLGNVYKINKQKEIEPFDLPCPCGWGIGYGCIGWFVYTPTWGGGILMDKKFNSKNVH